MPNIQYVGMDGISWDMILSYKWQEVQNNPSKITGFVAQW